MLGRAEELLCQHVEPGQPEVRLGLIAEHVEVLAHVVHEEHLTLLASESVREEVDLHENRVRTAEFRPTAGLADTCSD